MFGVNIKTNINSQNGGLVMILTLHIKNIGIIDDITINLENGFNCLTGEAGAGKSLIIESIGLLCGNRFSKEIIHNIWKIQIRTAGCGSGFGADALAIRERN